MYLEYTIRPIRLESARSELPSSFSWTSKVVIQYCIVSVGSKRKALNNHTNSERQGWRKDGVANNHHEKAPPVQQSEARNIQFIQQSSLLNDHVLPIPFHLLHIPVRRAKPAIPITSKNKNKRVGSSSQVKCIRTVQKASRHGQK
jgi:hypothetical protein